MTPDTLVEILFKVGFVGLSGKSRLTPYYTNGRSFVETWNLVAPSPSVHIHPAFSKYLDLVRVSMTAPRRSRKRGEVNPRQLGLDELL